MVHASSATKGRAGLALSCHPQLAGLTRCRGPCPGCRPPRACDLPGLARRHRGWPRQVRAVLRLRLSHAPPRAGLVHGCRPRAPSQQPHWTRCPRPHWPPYRCRPPCVSRQPVMLSRRRGRQILCRPKKLHKGSCFRTNSYTRMFLNLRFSGPRTVTLLDFVRTIGALAFLHCRVTGGIRIFIHVCPLFGLCCGTPK
jgi:hypothetical protein